MPLPVRRRTDPQACIRLDLTKYSATVLYNVVNDARYRIDAPPGTPPIPPPADGPWEPKTEAEVLHWLSCCLYTGLVENHGNGL